MWQLILNEAIKFSPIVETASSSGGNKGSSGNKGGSGGNKGGVGNTPGNAAGSSKRTQIANYATQFLGNPYVWGGTSLTSGADCSGFVQSVYRHFGVSIPRTSAEQAGFGREIAYEDMEPGDLVYYPGHVAMYIGNGQIVHASTERTGIKISNATYRTPVKVVRVLD